MTSRRLAPRIVAFSIKPNDRPLYRTTGAPHSSRRALALRCTKYMPSGLNAARQTNERTLTTKAKDRRMNDLDAAHSTPFAGLKPELVALARLARLAYAADAVRPHCDGPQPREPDVLAEVRADMLDGFHTILCGAGLMHTDGHEVDELALAEALVSSVLPAEEPAHPRVRVRAPSRPVTMKEAA